MEGALRSCTSFFVAQGIHPPGRLFGLWQCLEVLELDCLSCVVEHISDLRWYGNGKAVGKGFEFVLLTQDSLEVGLNVPVRCMDIDQLMNVVQRTVSEFRFLIQLFRSHLIFREYLESPVFW